MSHHLTTTKDLVDFIAPFKAKPPKVLGVDTEFMRRTTYWPKLCLIQLAFDDVICTIDPLQDIELSPLKPLFTNPNIAKVFHAASQDIECLEHALDVRIDNIFDVQIASMCLEPTYMPSYQALVLHHIGLTLEKGQQTIDWSRRPLSDRALTYARSDVLHLASLFHTFTRELEHKNRDIWIIEELARARDPVPLKPWQKIPKWTMLETQPSALTLLIQLSLWREHAARTHNRPRQKIASDQTLYTLAERADDTNIKARILSELGDDVWEHIQTYSVSLPPHVKALTTNQKQHIRALRAEANQVADAQNIPPTFLITHKEIEHYVRHQTPPKRLSGWRGTLLNWR
jgi:ribonuclease D